MRKQCFRSVALAALASMCAVCLVGCGGVVGGPGPQSASNEGVYLPSSTPFGKTYGEWAGEWLRWVFTTPADVNPLFDLTGANADGGQPGGPVWFLCGTTGSPPTAERTITVPQGKALFFPVINVWGIIPHDGPDWETVASSTSGLVDAVTEVEVTWDGAPLQGVFNYRFASPLISYVLLPMDQAPFPRYEGSTQGQTEGYYIMLEPPPPGQHELYFRGKATFPGSSYPNLGFFETAVNYHITIQ